MPSIERTISLELFSGKPLDSMLEALNKSKEDMERPVVIISGSEIRVQGEYVGENDHEQVSHIHQRYYRKVQSAPDGRIVHDGDCRFWGEHVCTCGLLHALLPLPQPDQIYPNFSEELGQQESVIHRLQFAQAQLIEAAQVIRKEIDHAAETEQPLKLTGEEFSRFSAALDEISD